MLVSYTWIILFCFILYIFTAINLTTLWTVHYKYFFGTLGFPVECLDGFSLSIFSLSFLIKCWTRSAGPIFIFSMRKISSSVISSKRLPSTLFWANVLHGPSQSLIRKNCSTSEMFHDSGASSSALVPAADCDAIESDIKHGINLPDVIVVFCNWMENFKTHFTLFAVLQQYTRYLYIAGGFSLWWWRWSILTAILRNDAKCRWFRWRPCRMKCRCLISGFGCWWQWCRLYWIYGVAVAIVAKVIIFIFCIDFGFRWHWFTILTFFEVVKFVSALVMYVQLPLYIPRSR